MATPIRRCWDLTEDHLREAIGSRQAMGDLLKELAAVAKPESGAAKILLALARLAKPSCDWIEGSLRVELDETDDKQTRIAVIEDLGGGVRELVFPRLFIDAPLSEFARSIRLAPRAVEPLTVQKAPGDRLVLGHKKARPSQKPPSFEVAEDSLRQTLTPAARKTIPPAPKGPPPLPKGPPPLPKKAAATAAPADRPAGPKLKRRSKAPAPKPADPLPMMMEIPRAPKVLDFGDLMPSPPKKKP